VARSFYQRG